MPSEQAKGKGIKASCIVPDTTQRQNSLEQDFKSPLEPYKTLPVHSGSASSSSGNLATTLLIVASVKTLMLVSVFVLWKRRRNSQLLLSQDSRQPQSFKYLSDRVYPDRAIFSTNYLASTESFSSSEDSSSERNRFIDCGYQETVAQLDSMKKVSSIDQMAKEVKSNIKGSPGKRQREVLEPLSSALPSTVSGGEFVNHVRPHSQDVIKAQSNVFLRATKSEGSGEVSAGASVSKAAVDDFRGSDGIDLFSRYDNIVRQMVFRDEDRLLRAQARDLIPVAEPPKAFSAVGERQSQSSLERIEASEEASSGGALLPMISLDGIPNNTPSATSDGSFLRFSSRSIGHGLERVNSAEVEVSVKQKSKTSAAIEKLKAAKKKREQKLLQQLDGLVKNRSSRTETLC